MHELSFADAARQTPAVVLNLPLAEYSIGHELLLLRARNALVVSSPEEFSKLDFVMQLHAIREAVWICSDPFSVREKFERPAFINWRFRWNEWKRKRWVKWLDNSNLLPMDYALAVAEFRNYLASAHPHIPGPGPHAVDVLYPDEQAKGRGMGQPMVLSLYHFVITLPKEERPKCAWDFPYGMATWLFFSKMESLGNYRIENFEERDEQSVMDEAKASRGNKEETSNVEHLTPNAEGLATVPLDLSRGDV